MGSDRGRSAGFQHTYERPRTESTSISTAGGGGGGGGGYGKEWWVAGPVPRPIRLRLLKPGQPEFNTVIGCTRRTRRTGSQQASSPVVPRMKAATPSSSGSRGSTPNSRLSSKRV